MTAELETIHSLLEQAKTDQAAMDALSASTPSIQSWFLSASLVSFGGVTPQQVLKNFGRQVLLDYIRDKRLGVFE